MESGTDETVQQHSGLLGENGMEECWLVEECNYKEAAKEAWDMLFGIKRISAPNMKFMMGSRSKK